MSKVSLSVLNQKAAAVNSCVSNVESTSLNKYEETSETAEDLRNSWDEFYSMFLDLHENLKDFISEVES